MADGLSQETTLKTYIEEVLAADGEDRSFFTGRIDLIKRILKRRPFS